MALLVAVPLLFVELIWSLAARSALKKIGVDPPGPVRRDKARLLALLDANRSRLPGGGRTLHRVGVMVSAGFTAWLAGVIVFSVALALVRACSR